MSCSAVPVLSKTVISSGSASFPSGDYLAKFGTKKISFAITQREGSKHDQLNAAKKAPDFGLLLIQDSHNHACWNCGSTEGVFHGLSGLKYNVLFISQYMLYI
jgi:hypothetical protein